MIRTTRRKAMNFNSNLIIGQFLSLPLRPSEILSGEILSYCIRCHTEVNDFPGTADDSYQTKVLRRLSSGSGRPRAVGITQTRVAKPRVLIKPGSGLMGGASPL